MSDTPRKAPVIPADMKAFNARLIAGFHANHGQFTGDMAGRGLLILTTTGASPCEPPSVVLGFGRHGDPHGLLSSDNGAPNPPALDHNLLATPNGTIRLPAADPFEVRA